MMLLARRAANATAPSGRRNRLPVPPHVVVCGSGAFDSFGTFRPPLLPDSSDATDCGARVSPSVGILWNGPIGGRTNWRSRAVNGSYRRTYSTKIPLQLEEKNGTAVDDVFANPSAPPFSESFENHFSTQDDPSALTETASPLTDVAAAAASEFVNINFYVLNTNYPSHMVMKLVTSLSEYSDVSLAVSIFAVAVFLRTGLIPYTVRQKRQSSQMKHVTAEMEILTNRMIADPGIKTDPALKKNYHAQIQSIYRKYDCIPLTPLYHISMFLLVQNPMFMTMIFGLHTLPDYFPAVTASGGHLWFQDLAVSDPYYILPFITSATFLCRLEISDDKMNTQKEKRVKNALRGLGVIMFPVTAHFPAAVFCYWVPDNIILLGQAVLLNKVPVIKKLLGILDPPKTKTRES